jgi:pimeloyl-ACP methyl ester carboxylesterase
MRYFTKWLLLAAMVSLCMFSPLMAQDTEVTFMPYTSEMFGFETVIPEGWADLGQGIFARQLDGNTDDPTLIAQQAAPLAADALLNAILPQLGLTEAPESAGPYQGGTLEWTLYTVEVETPNGTLAVDLALANQSGTTYLVLTQSASDEYDLIHQTIFLPTLDAYAPLVESMEFVSYLAEDVTFENGDITLAGTLTLPDIQGPHPAVVLITGSGPQDRDESLAPVASIKPFRLIADALTPEGIAVLRYDDRGVGESTGDYSTATTDDLATDAAAAVDYLLTRDDIDPDQIGVLGHSEGGTITAMLGATNSEIAFIISMAGTAVNGRDILIVQNQRLMEAEGATQEQIDSQIAFVEELFEVIEAEDNEALETLIYERALEQAEMLTAEEREALGDLETYARMSAEQGTQTYGGAWFQSFLNYDPGVDWAQTTVPVLALFGGKDVQVDAEQNAPVLEAALEEAGNEDYEIVIFPNANHLFQESETGALSEYGELPDEFTPDFLPTIIDWLLERVTVAE